jgi:hypothetical protein
MCITLGHIRLLSTYPYRVFVYARIAHSGSRVHLMPFGVGFVALICVTLGVLPVAVTPGSAYFRIQLINIFTNRRIAAKLIIKFQPSL